MYDVGKTLETIATIRNIMINLFTYYYIGYNMHPPYTMYPFEFITKKRNQCSTYIFEYRKDIHKGPVQWMHADRVHNNIIYILLYRHVLAATQLTQQPDMVRFYGIAACRKLHIYNIHIIHTYIYI